MTYRPHILVQFGGRLFSTEQWSCGLRMTLGDPETLNLVSEESMQEWAVENIQDIADDITAWFTRSTSYISSAARLDFVKANTIRADGRYWDEEGTNVLDLPLQTAPQGGVTPGEPQNTVAISLLTAATRGRAHRGRVYPPTGNLPVTAATGKLSASVPAEMAASFGQLIDELNNEPGFDVQSPRVVIASDLGNPGPARNVTAVTAGDVVDTQRRRRRSLVEAYATPVGVTIV